MGWSQFHSTGIACPEQCLTLAARGASSESAACDISTIAPTPPTQLYYGVASTQATNAWSALQTFSQGITATQVNGVQTISPSVTDPCVAIASTISSLLSAGGKIDLSGVAGGTCASTLTISKPVKIDVGAGTFTFNGNTNQVFKWRRELKKCELIEAVAGSAALLPVSFSTPCRLCEPCRPFLYWRRPPSLVLQTLTKVRGAMSHPKDSIRRLALPMSPFREWRAA